MQIKAIYVLPLVIISLLLAVWSGWLRIGWALPAQASAAHHGSLMVGSFLSTVIFLERAVTFKNKRVLLLPFLNGLSALFFIAGLPVVAHGLLLAASIGFGIMCLHFIYKYQEVYYYLFFAGAFALLIGNWLLLKTNFYPIAAPWWMGFFLFTIVAERLELSRFLPVSKTKKIQLFISLFIAFAGLIIPFHLNGDIVFAAGLIFTALWLLKNDMAMKSVKKAGQHRYSAVLLITGYFWLIATACLLFAGNVSAFWYDATLHSFFIGFVISMIFSHAPIILPAVLKLPVKPYRPYLYLLFIVMQLSLTVRIIADVLVLVQLRMWAGIINGITLLTFFAAIASIVQFELVKRKKALKV